MSTMGHKLHCVVWALAGSLWASVAAASAPRELAQDDLAWLNRVTYGISSTTVARFRADGRRQFLREQLNAGATLPPAVSQQIQSLEISRTDGATLLREVANEQKRINTLPEGEPREAARKALNEHGNALANEAARREILRAIYSSSQLQEQLTWFWLNHFSVLKDKANGRWLVADYTERAIRPHALGHFVDLVMATLQHPMMLQYLDNAQNANGHINENYARELLELHTLGVGSGYTQQDVQELARILTGVGVNPSGDEPKLKKEWQPLYLRDGAFEFNPARHDFGDKTLLGQHVTGAGFDEVRRAVELIVSHPACARFVSRKLAMYFVADDPPPHLVEQMSRTFTKTRGDIRAVLETMFASKELTRSLGGKFRDPMQYVIASVRLAYDDRPIENVRPIMNWLNALGEPLWGRATPDGYPLVSSAWTSSGQMSRRFEIARAIGSGNAGLFQPMDGSAPERTGFPQIATPVYYDSIEPRLAADTRAALDKASSQAEWNTFLLASPDLNYH
jgi:uncharacterized protein (DUF1800 family)